MDINNVSAVIGNLGFPIACCVALFWRMIKSDEQHKEEIDKLSGVIAANTTVLERICDKMEVRTNE